MVKLLVEAGGNVSARSNDGRSVVFEAAVKGMKDIVEWLLSQGTDATIPDEDGVTPFHAAATADLAMVKLLCGADVELNVRTLEGKTIFHSAASAGKIDVVRRLTAPGLDTQGTEWNGLGPLHNAMDSSLAVSMKNHDLSRA